MLAKSTRRVYGVALKKYKRFWRKYSFRQLPLHQSTLCLYFTYLARSLSFKSIKLYLCAVKQYALAHGFRDRLPNMHQLHFTLRGIKRKLGATGNRKPRMPITIVLLKQIKSYIMSTYPNLVDQRMLLAAYSCLLQFPTEFRVYIPIKIQIP